MQKLASHKVSKVNSSNKHIVKLLKEACKLLSVSIAIFLYIALLSYDQSDSGWSKIGYENTIKNSAGYVGAWFSDLFFHFFGYLAYLFPIILVYATFQVVKEYKVDEVNYNLLILKLLGLFLSIISVSAILSLLFLDTGEGLPYSSGGILGDYVGFGIMEVFNFIGSLIFLCTFFLIGITLLSGISWFELGQKLTINIIKTSRYLIDYIKNIFQNFKKQILSYRNNKKIQKQDVANKFDIIKMSHEVKSNSNTVKNKIQTRLANTFSKKEEKNKEPSSLKDTSSIKAPILKNDKPIPSLALLDQKSDDSRVQIDKTYLEGLSKEVEQKLADFGIKAEVVGIQPGPVVTRFEIELAPGIKASKITSLSKDLARSLSVTSVRVVEVIPGKTYVGLELPNKDREMVLLSEVLETEQYSKSKASLVLALGKDISGYPVIVDLAKMPHLLVAGTTGAGKSVGINTMLISLLYKSSPEDVRLILVDPKMLELSVYEDIHHLLAPVVTDMKEAANALRWCVAEMERRYSLMAQVGVRNISGYNKKILENKPSESNTDHIEKLPHIVIVIDEFADMIMVVGKKVEQLIARIAQKARAAGIHMILATQRPSVDVITGLIKSNIPTRIAYQVSSRIDSRTILDQQGAEQLLGHGDMLYLPPGLGSPIRVHGAFVADHEVHKVTRELKKRGKPEYVEAIVDGVAALTQGGEHREQDELYEDALNFIRETKKVSVSSIQRKFRIGYNRAASIVEAMEVAGAVSPMQNNGSREVLL